MRLREIQKIIQDNLPVIAIASAQVNASATNHQVTNLINAKKGLDGLLEIPALRNEVESLRATSIYSTVQDSIIISNAELNTIQGSITRIKTAANFLLVAIDDSLHNTSLTAEALSIKIPKITDFDELSNFTDKLKKSIALPIAELEDGGQIKILNFDSGTFWIDILLPTASSVLLAGSIAWAGAVIYKKYQEAFAFKHYAEGLEIQKEHLKSLQEAAEKLLNLQIESEAKLIQSQFYKIEDIEQLNRLKLSVKEMSELIQKGVQIQPSLAMPEKISNLFPNYKMMELIESKIKHLPETAN